jgi:hypothetical protein
MLASAGAILADDTYRGAAPKLTGLSRLKRGAHIGWQ